MDYPTLNPIRAQRSSIEAFGGYNNVLRPGEGEWRDMLNLSSDNFPVMSTRHRRGLFREATEMITGVIAKDELCWTAGRSFFYGGKPVDMGLTDTQKQLVSMGAYVIILPDRKWINTMDLSWGSIDSRWEAAGAVTMRLSTLEGDDQEVAVMADEEPGEPVNGMVWMDTSTTPHTLKKYSEASALWVSFATTYVRIEAEGIGKEFGLYDGITLDGLQEDEHEDVQALNGAAIVWNKGDDFIVIVGVLDAVRTVRGLSVSRRMPEMDFVVESGNRLWGCRYGLAGNGEVVNEIYASKLGDFKNWSCYMGISTDSYAVSIGSDGPFTGAITHGGYPLFFKENYLHKIYGQIPANFQVQSTACRGVQRGSAESLAIVNEVLYYLGTTGVCAYDGSLPVEVSSQFGAVRYHGGAGAGCGNKYYLRAVDLVGEESIFVLDTARKLWHRESGCGGARLCGFKGDVIAARGNELISLLGNGEKTAEESFHWMAETGIIGASGVHGKNLCKAALRMALEPGSTLRMSVQYDSIGPWLEIGRMRSRSLKAFLLPLRMHRCDHLRLRLEGDGDCVLYGIIMDIEATSDQTNADGLVLG